MLVERIKELVRQAALGDAAFEVAPSAKQAFGHYSTNVALRLSRERGVNPLAAAEEIALKIRAAAPQDLFLKVEVVPPGFINFWLAPAAIQQAFSEAYKNKKTFGAENTGKRQTVIFEYSDPNIAKRMHVGHLRATIIGDALANIYESLGYKVIRWNYIGDWGTQFGKMIAAYKRWGNKKEVEENPIERLQALYVRFHDEMKRDPALEKEGQEEFRKLEAGNRESKKIWEWFRKESLKEFEKLYTTLNVSFDLTIGEAFYEKDLRPLIADMADRGIAKRSEGALIIPLDAFGLPPALVQKSDDASLYLTRDIANLKYRLKKYTPAKMYYVVGNEQSLHFAQLFAIAKILKLDSTELAHVKYGLVLGEDAKKLATREGKTVLLEELVQKVITLARGIVEKKNPSLSPNEKERIARAVGIGALKYNDLKENRHSDIVFNWERMLDISGDSAPYLQYTYARLESIRRKAGTATTKTQTSNIKCLGSEAELALMRKIFDLPDVIELSARELMTSHLAKYLYELGGMANQFYETTPVLKDEHAERRSARLALIDMVGLVLKRGLGLLGIEALEQM